MLPFALLADSTNGAILRSNGTGVFVNGDAVLRPVIGIFADDLIQTVKSSLARIETNGSAINIDPETVVQFKPDELVLHHGSLSVYTRGGMRVRVGCLTVSPADSSNETLYEAVDRDGKVTVHATERDVYFDAAPRNSKRVISPSQSSGEVVRAGEQKSREEECAAAARKASAIGGVLNGPWPMAAGAVAIGGTTVWVLCKDDDPISPSSPSRSAPCPIP